MEGRTPTEHCWGNEFQQRQTTAGPGLACYLQGFDGEHLVLCLMSAMAMYIAGYIIARLFYTGLMFCLSVGLLAFLVVQVVNSVDSGTGDARYHYNAW